MHALLAEFARQRMLTTQIHQTGKSIINKTKMIEFVFDQTFEVSDSYIRREKVVIIIYI